VNDCTSTSLVISAMAITAKTATKMNCATTKTKFAPATRRMPRTFSPVTTTTARMIQRACGVLGK
jgi:hypothetical protein